MGDCSRRGPSDAFGSLHPSINFIVFAFVLVISMVVRHPALLAVSIACGAAYCVLLRGGRGCRLLAAMVPVFVLLSVLNPLFNSMGETVLFAYLDGRVYTWESLCFGMSTAAMFVSIILWFACYSAVMTSDKFTYLFAPVIPALSMVLTLALRMIPGFQRKLGQMAVARRTVGAVDGGALSNGVTLASMLATWAFEGSLTTADSMKARGWGAAKRTSYSVYRFGSRDKALFVVLVVCAVVVAVCVLAGAMAVEFFPSLSIAPVSPLFLMGLFCFALLAGAPLFVNAAEVIAWRISLSKM